MCSSPPARASKSQPAVERLSTGHQSKCQSLSRARLFATPRTAAHQVPLSTRFSRQGYWSGLPLPSPGDLPWDWTQVSCTSGRSLYWLSYKGRPSGIHQKKKETPCPKTKKKLKGDGRRGAIMIKSNPIPTRWATHYLENNNTKEVLPLLWRFWTSCQAFQLGDSAKELGIPRECDFEGQWALTTGLP